MEKNSKVLSGKFTPKQIRNWRAYEKVRASGITNMFAVNIVCDYSGLKREEVLFCMENYSKLKERAIAKATRGE